jgi:hypothetical protein
MTLTEAEHRRRVTDAERRVAEANRRAANCRAAERRAEEVNQAERRAAEAEQRAAETERKANASIVARPIIAPPQPKPIRAPAPPPAQRLTSREAPAMSPEKLALLHGVESASARLASARQGLEDAKHLYRAGMASDPAFAAHVVAGAIHEWNRACAAYLSFKG